MDSHIFHMHTNVILQYHIFTINKTVCNHVMGCIGYRERCE